MLHPYFRFTSGAAVESPQAVEEELRRPGHERRSNWLWRFRDEEAEERQIEQVQEKVVKELKRAQKKAPDRAPSKQIATLAGKTVEQHQKAADFSAQIMRSVLSDVGITLKSRELTIGELLTQQGLLYGLIRLEVKREAEAKAKRLAEEDDEAAAEMLLLM